MPESLFRTAADVLAAGAQFRKYRINGIAAWQPGGEAIMTALHRIIVLAALLTSGPAMAQYSDGVVKIGVLTDMSGLYSELAGPGSVAAARLAVEDFGAAAKGIKVEIIGGDIQNKTDVGVNIATSWFDIEKVDVIVDLPN